MTDARVAEPQLTPTQVTATPATATPATVVGEHAGRRAIYHAQVRWSDPDIMGHINHTRYLSYFEDARMTLLSSSPSGLAGTPADRGYIAARVAVDYLYPVQFTPGLHLRVETWVDRIGTSSWTLPAEMYDGDHLVARCESVIVAYSYEHRRSRPLGKDERTFWEQYLL